MPPSSLPLPDRLPFVEGKPDTQAVLNVLTTYLDEAKNAREGGPNPRDEVWRRNWDIYWGRHDFSAKAAWQSQIVMPEAPNFVDRWAAALREALVSSGRFYDVTDPGDQNRDLVPHVVKFMDFLLGRCGRTAQGHVLDFSAVFEEQMKLGAVMMCGAAVTWKPGPDGGFVACETVDPREVYLDHTGRGQYRVRRTEVEKHELLKLAEILDEEGDPVYDIEEIKALASAEVEKEGLRRATGHDQSTGSRDTVTLDEYLASIVLTDGTVVAENALIVVANGRFIIRGPEANPFWHERDWVVMAPLVTVPLSVYGRSYMEDWSSVAEAFVEMTNLILDATFAESIRAFVMQPDMLEDPTQAQQGIHPGVTFLLAEGQPVADFMKQLEVGTLGAGPVRVWEALKAEMREGAKLNEISLGQLAPTERTATEISQTQQSSSSIIRSIARTIESRFLEPVLTLMWKTGLQHTDFNDPLVQRTLGPDTAAMLGARREEFAQRQTMQFRVRGISALVDRQAKLRNLLSMLQVVGSNEILLQQFLTEFSPAKVFGELVTLFGVDPTTLRPTEQERQLQALAQPAAAPTAGGSPPAVPGEDDSAGALG
jgi:hypothetical protein